MSEPARWHEGNDAFLGAALEWLRIRLLRLAAEAEPSGVGEAQATAPSAPGSLRSRLFGGSREPDPSRALPPGVRPTEDDVARAAATMEEAGRMDPSPALLLLGRRLGLSPFERKVLLLSAAPELDPGIQELYGRAQGAPGRAHPTFALAMALFDDPAWEVLSPHRPLRYWRLVEITQPGGEPLTTSSLRADERIVNYLKGLNYLDDRLTPLLVPFESGFPSDGERGTDSAAPDGGTVPPGEAGDGSPREGRPDALPPSQARTAEDVVDRLRRTSENGAAAVVQLVGIDALSQHLVARAATGRLGLRAYRLPVEGLPRDAGELETLARLWERESRLLPVALLLDAYGLDGETKEDGTPGDPLRSLQRFLARSGGMFLVGTREARAGVTSGAAVVEVGRPTPAEQRALWADALGPEAGKSPGLLAGQFNLNGETIRVIVAKARDPAEGPSTPHERLWDACLAHTAPRMDRLAQRLRPVATWEDLVLPAHELHLLRRLAGQVARRATVYDEWGFRERMNRGLGISALFVGESGTGKTMAAEVIANDLRLNLYRIDLSAVVSKYIGETEKNLRRVFDAAEDGGAILFFDEADALFGKRSEVRDSHDRYANIEINYLLQRMESYRGLAILATNMKSALDPAFMRRLRFVVTFPFPGRTEREAIWRRAWPGETPVASLDHHRLARFNLTGGSIANAALNAAFLAAEGDAEVGMPVVLDAVRTELRKLGRPVREEELRWEPPEAPGTGTNGGPGTPSDPTLTGSSEGGEPVS